MSEVYGTLISTFGIIGVSFVVAIVIAIVSIKWMRSMGSTEVKNGVTAPAQILKTWDTGMSVNDNPVVGMLVNVQPANEPAFQMEMKQLVSRIQIGMFIPGAQVEVMYDPANHKKIKIHEVGAGYSSGQDLQALALQQALLAKDQVLAAVRAMGESAEATILNVTDMGVQVGDAAKMKKFNLEVRPSGRPSFHAETQAAVSSASDGKYTAGRTVAVKFNPNDLTQVALDHA